MRTVRLALVALAFLVAPGKAAEPPGSAGMVKGIVEDFVLPRYDAFAAATATLAETLAGLCESPSAAALARARENFAAAVARWSFVELIRVGPAAEHERLERILFWPDRRGIGLRQVQEILATRDPTAVDVDALAGKSVAVQGFGALEFVLFGTGSEALEGAAGADPWRCAYGRTVAASIRARAAEIATAWREPGGIAARWTAPGPENPLWRDGGEALGELVDILVHGLDLVRDVRIGGFLAEAPGQNRPRQALFWRSRLTVATIDDNLAALADIAATADFAAHLPGDLGWIADGIRFEFANARKALVGLSGRPIAEILADPQERGRLAYARLVTSSLSELVGTRLSGAFGITAGFSALDGD